MGRLNVEAEHAMGDVARVGHGDVDALLEDVGEHQHVVHADDMLASRDPRVATLAII